MLYTASITAIVLVGFFTIVWRIIRAERGEPRRDFQDDHFHDGGERGGSIYGKRPHSDESTARRKNYYFFSLPLFSAS